MNKVKIWGKRVFPSHYNTTDGVFDTTFENMFDLPGDVDLGDDRIPKIIKKFDGGKEMKSCSYKQGVLELVFTRIQNQEESSQSLGYDSE